ncbi:MAG: DNA-directed RNA polymerase subunit K [Methanobacteriota archaeon]|nr:MAG: DNA-directed RNA polymerase subunit K [Euryarchaeota archaeon]
MKLKQTTTYTPRGDQLERKLTRFEKARIIGARALQIAMGAPILVDPPDNVSDPIEIALLELERGVIPLTIRRKETNRKTPSS